MRFSFSKNKRVRKRTEFERVYAGKQYVADDNLVIHYVTNEEGISRLGLSIGRRVGNAVFRNRWKRRIREAFRLAYHQLPSGIDLVVRPRQHADCDFRRIHNSLRGLAKRIKTREAKRS